jgi:hypothetical protein
MINFHKKQVGWLQGLRKDAKTGRIGVIRGEEVVAAIQDSGAKEILLAFEIRTPVYHPQECGHLSDLRTSVEYWREWVKD